MRIAATLIVLAAFGLGAITLAGAADDAPTPEETGKRLKALEMQVEYLRSREAALTAYIVQNQQRAAGIRDVTRRSRVAGFEQRKIPVDSRIILLKGFDDLAASLQKDLPVVSKEEATMRKRADAFVKANKLGGGS